MEQSTEPKSEQDNLPLFALLVGVIAIISAVMCGAFPILNIVLPGGIGILAILLGVTALRRGPKRGPTRSSHRTLAILAIVAGVLAPVFVVVLYFVGGSDELFEQRFDPAAIDQVEVPAPTSPLPPPEDVEEIEVELPDEPAVVPPPGEMLQDVVPSPTAPPARPIVPPMGE